MTVAKSDLRIAAHYLITPDGDYYDLGALGVRVTGLGSVPLENISWRGYKQHGETYEATYLRPRTLRFALELHSGSWAEIWPIRTQLLNALSISGEQVRYQFVLPNGNVREIRGVVGGDTSIEHLDARAAQAAFSLVCHDPTFYDPSAKSAAMSTSVADALVIPFYIPDEHWYGEGLVLGATVNNAGTWRAYPRVTITGGYQRVGLHNTTTDALIVLGVAASSSDTVVVDFDPSNRGVWRNGGLSLDEVESGNMVDWYLQPGTNVIKLTGSINAGTAAIVEFNERYLAL